MDKTENVRREITRREAREQAFALIFEKSFHDYNINEIIDNAESNEIFIDEFAETEAAGAYDHLAEIDEHISANLKGGWNFSRISRVTKSILRLAVYEMLFADEIPVSVAINEAVELAKKYGGDEDPSYINGVLGAIARSLDIDDDLTIEAIENTETASEDAEVKNELAKDDGE